MIFKTMRARIAVAILGVMAACFSPAGVQAARLLFTNNASTTIATAINSTATSVTVASSTGAKFPHPTGAQYFRATIVKSGTPSQFEIVKVVAGGSGDTFTIQRGQEGTAAQSWSVGDFFNLFATAADLADLVQVDDLQIESGNYAVDSGTANAYVVSLSPALTQHQVGMPIRVKIANTNTSVSATLNPGPGPVSIVAFGGAQIVPSNIVAGCVCTFVYDGLHYQFVGPYLYSFSQIVGQIGNSQVPLSAVTQYTPQILASAALTGTPTSPTASPGTNNTQVASTAFVTNAVASNRGSTGGGNPYFEARPTGIIEQWGTYTYTSRTGAQVIPFAIPFPTRVESVVISPAAANIGWDTWIINGTITVGGFQFNDDSGSPNVVTVHWRAIGR